jgi:hypothetical protein
MGLGTRIFILKEDDSLQRLSLKRYNRLIKGHPDEGLMQYTGKRIRYALIVLEMINRKPFEIIMTEYSFLAFDPKGRLDASERERLPDWRWIPWSHSPRSKNLARLSM